MNQLERPERVEPRARPRYRWLVALGFVLAVPAMILGPVFAVIPVVIGLVLATSGRLNAGIAIVVTTILLVFIPRIVLFLLLDGGTYRIPSGAMEPTIEIGDRIYARGDDTPERSDLFVFHPPAGATGDVSGERCGAPHPAKQACDVPTGGPAESAFLKRVVALPGDRVKIVDNRAYVNGRRLEEPYVRTEPCPDVCNLPREITIPPDHYFMLGDNRGESDDSRTWGPVHRDWLEGRVVFRYAPLDRLGTP